MKPRFEVHRRENRRWLKWDVVRTSEVCVILDKMLIKMVQNRIVWDEDGDTTIMERYKDENRLI